MKATVIFLLHLTMASLVQAQTKSDSLGARPANSINGNLMGDGSILSLNYERLFPDGKNLFWAGSIGIGFSEEFQICVFGPCDPPKKYTIIPHHFTANLGKKKHFFEAGFGGSYVGGSTSEHYFLYPIIGYRYQPLKAKKLNFRVFGSMPVGGLKTEDILFVPLGLSAGICF
jgi:hypothetical protein